jgi:DivIVA domain-containing protein
MALLPEDILSKRFLTTKFREGYDQDEVDDFLDEVVLEFRRVITENQDLKAGGSNLGESLAAPAKAVSFPEANNPASDGSLEGTDSSKSIIELAQKLHEDHVRDGQVKRDQLVREGQEQAARLVRDAEAESREALGKLEIERKMVLEAIEELKLFEADYREQLRRYIEDQLDQLTREEAAATVTPVEESSPSGSSVESEDSTLTEADDSEGEQK